MGETIIESWQGRGVGRVEAGKRAQDQQGGDERDVRHTHLPFGKRTHQAEMAICRAIAVEALMEAVTDREGCRRQQEHRQQADKC